MSKSNPVFERLDREKLTRMLEIKGLYEKGQLAFEDAKARMAKEVGRISPEEFAAAEQLLKDENPDECRNENVRNMLDLFGELISDQLPETPYGHPIDAYRRENEKAKELLAQGDLLAQKAFSREVWRALMEQLMGYKLHFSRKQNQLYSALERKGFDRPSTTMWSYDDHIRDEMNRAHRLLEDGSPEEFLATFQEMSTDLRDLMSKEELILYPTALKLLSVKEFEEMERGDREIGFFQIDMPALRQREHEGAQGHIMEELSALLSRYGMGGGAPNARHQKLDVAEGKLTLEQINLLYRHMPVDFSYVDEEELVAFYTDTKHRVFPRSKEVIGREVRKCHPPKSVHIVEEIIEKFRSGEQSKAEFWINKPGAFIYIVYIAVRDEQGRFRGVLEMMQDCTHIRALEGSRTLLTWDQEQQTPKDDSEAETEAGNAIDPQSITEKTKLKDLLRAYPQLKEDLPTINPKFSMLQSPMAKIILPVATIKMMSERSGMDLDTLLAKIRELIASYK